MRVKAKDDTDVLIKGNIYSLIDVKRSGNWRQYLVETECGKRLGWYYADKFVLMDGKDLDPTKDYMNEQKDAIPEVGSIIICNVKTYRYLIKGGKYRISSVETCGSSYYPMYKIKLEGYDKELWYNNKTFKLLSKKESRKIKISQIFNKKENFTVDFKKRMIEQFDNKNKKLFDILSKSATNDKRHVYDPIDWVIKKSEKNLDLRREDFNEIMDMKLSDILERYFT